MSFTRMDSVTVAGWCSSPRSATSWSNSSRDSPGRRQQAPVKPWRELLREEMPLPSSEVGPVDSFAFSRLASSFFGDRMASRTEIFSGVLLIRVSFQAGGLYRRDDSGATVGGTVSTGCKGLRPGKKESQTAL